LYLSFTTNGPIDKPAQMAGPTNGPIDKPAQMAGPKLPSRALFLLFSGALFYGPARLTHLAGLLALAD
jgi:hypothetical protein